MKACLAVTGALFSAFAVMHTRATVAVWNRVASEPGMVLGRAGIALVTGALATWAWRLFRSSAVPG